MSLHLPLAVCSPGWPNLCLHCSSKIQLSSRSSKSWNMQFTNANATSLGPISSAVIHQWTGWKFSSTGCKQKFGQPVGFTLVKLRSHRSILHSKLLHFRKQKMFKIYLIKLAYWVKRTRVNATLDDCDYSQRHLQGYVCTSDLRCDLGKSSNVCRAILRLRKLRA